METWFDRLKAALDHKQRAVLATVISGSAYVSNKIVIYEDKTTYGTLGSYMLDNLVMVDAMQTIWRNDAHLHTYSLVDEDSAQQHFEVFIEGYATIRLLLLTPEQLSLHMIASRMPMRFLLPGPMLFSDNVNSHLLQPLLS